MIARLWRGVAATEADADAYARHPRGNVIPALRVVEPEARGVLAQFDDFVRHYEVEE